MPTLMKSRASMGCSRVPDAARGILHAAAQSRDRLHLSRRERSDRIARCDPGEGLRSTARPNAPHPALRADLSPTGRGEELRPGNASPLLLHRLALDEGLAAL